MTTKIQISPGDSLTIGFLDEEGYETDGEFEVRYKAQGLSITTDFADDTNRVGVIYDVEFSLPDPDDIPCM